MCQCRGPGRKRTRTGTTSPKIRLRRARLHVSTRRSHVSPSTFSTPPLHTHTHTHTHTSPSTQRTLVQALLGYRKTITAAYQRGTVNNHRQHPQDRWRQHRRRVPPPADPRHPRACRTASKFFLQRVPNKVGRFAPRIHTRFKKFARFCDIPPNLPNILYLGSGRKKLLIGRVAST